MKQMAILLLMLCSLAGLAQKIDLSKQGTTTILELSYAISNNMSTEVLDKNFDNTSGLSEEEVREIKSMFTNAVNTYGLFVNTKTFESLFEAADNFDGYTEDEKEGLSSVYVMIKAPFFYKNTNLFDGIVEMGNTQRFALKNASALTWKITNETKKIGDWQCRKAVPEGDFMSDNTSVWFAEEAPFPSGPMHYFGLPGLVVEVTIPNLIRVQFTGMKYAKITPQALQEKIKAHALKMNKEKAMPVSKVREAFKEAAEMGK